MQTWQLGKGARLIECFEIRENGDQPCSLGSDAERMEIFASSFSESGKGTGHRFSFCHIETFNIVVQGRRLKAALKQAATKQAGSMASNLWGFRAQGRAAKILFRSHGAGEGEQPSVFGGTQTTFWLVDSFCFSSAFTSRRRRFGCFLAFVHMVADIYSANAKNQEGNSIVPSARLRSKKKRLATKYFCKFGGSVAEAWGRKFCIVLRAQTRGPIFSS